jgi:hypothetical protein
MQDSTCQVCQQRGSVARINLDPHVITLDLRRAKQQQFCVGHGKLPDLLLLKANLAMLSLHYIWVRSNICLDLGQ